MVRTTTGPAEKSKPDDAEPQLTAEDRKLQKALDLDDATWDRLQQMATSQQTSPSDVVRRAIESQYGGGSWSPASASEAYNAR